MQIRQIVLMVAVLALSACDNFVPREKVATYDPVSGLVLPYPCPDWSQTQVHNYMNELHSNFGCAVNNNAAVQLDDPRDLVRGHGDSRPDTGISTQVITDYRAGKIPTPLAPAPASTGGGSQ